MLIERLESCRFIQFAKGTRTPLIDKFIKSFASIKLRAQSLNIINNLDLNGIKMQSGRKVKGKATQCSSFLQEDHLLILPNLCVKTTKGSSKLHASIITITPTQNRDTD